ncbi:Putative Adenylate cyclase (modular protein) [Thiomonas sp. X19]|uniref:FHA domain-containing protein n=1 Tax=Thiomonas sp. X19 TaxID=1050370 RepID=UPI000B626C53|nr:FHA domain-containing protein [Thiomonas sp. X19]SCC93819.1 Putative Adenylate cyclase (modular protein) [Thiomonas sp. X19]SCC93858.1 Putative Adenylate cyclase (modular protein) [Thiomonas sp. X19]
MFEKWRGLRPASVLVALSAQIPATHALFVLMGETKALAFMERTINRLAHRAAAASGLVVHMDSTSLLVLFEQAEQALQAASAMRLHLDQWCQNFDAHLRLDLDMGLSCGAVLCRPPTYEGETLLRAVSLATGASDGQTLLDEAVVARLPETLVSQLQPAAAADTDGVRAWMVACTQAPGTPRAAPLWLNLRSPDGRVNMTFTPGRPIRIGRDPRADVVLRTAVISRQHVVIAWRHGSYTLSDTSRNGTWLQTGLTGAVTRIAHNVGLLGGAGSLRLGREPQACRPPDLLFSVTPPPAGHDPALDPSGSGESFASTGPFA